MSASGLIIIGSMMLAAEFIFGMAMVSKASRSEKANNAEKENDTSKKVIAATSAVMMTTLLAFGVAVACVSGKSGDKTEDSAPVTVAETSTGAETTTEAETTTTTRTTTTTTETTTTTTTTTLPLSELVKHGSKGCVGEFDTVYASHNDEIIIDGIAEEGPTIKTGESDVYVPAEVDGYRIRAIDVGGLNDPVYSHIFWPDGISTVYVLPEMQFIITTWDADTMKKNFTELSFDEAASYFSQCGMLLQKYDADKVTVEKELLPLNEVVILLEQQSYILDYNCRYIYLNDNSVIIEGVSDSQMIGNENLKHTDVIRIYDEFGWHKRAITVNGDWNGLKTIDVPVGMSFVERKGSEFVEVPFEKAKEIFAEKGISIETY